LTRYLTLGFILGFQDLKQAYRRSALGPFWITIGMTVQIATMAAVFGTIFKVDLQTYLPFLAVGIGIWTVISGILNEGCLSFIASEGIIRQLPIPLFVFILRNLWKNILIFMHHFVVVLLVLIFCGVEITWATPLAFLGFLILVGNLTWLAYFLATISARFRDFPPIIGSLLTVAFYVTPVMWFPTLLPPDVAHLLLGLNPLYHLIQVFRMPLLGQFPTIENWVISGLIFFVGLIASKFLYARTKHRIAFWV
jgi:ABC-type polysaccharide/polyol phosphate export permease